MIQYRKDTDQIVTLILDMEGQVHNVINYEMGKVLDPVIDQLLKEKQTGSLRGVIITSAKNTFLAGGRLSALFDAEDPHEIYYFTVALKRVLRKLEQPGVPVVAAINGTALGAGFELALACHHRIAIADPDIRLGLPEVSLGLIPGSGSVIRLMWMMGIERAYEVLVEGRRYGPHEAQRQGLIDELATDSRDMMDKARRRLLQNNQSCRKWDQPGATIPDGNALQPLVAQRIGALAAQAVARYHYLYPAPHTILNILSEASKVDFDVALQLETRFYIDLIRHPTTKNMLKALWFDYNYIKRGNNRPKGYGRFRPKTVGVIGAGRMGSGIALACLRRGLSVVLKDVNLPVAQRGRQYIKDRLAEWVDSARLLPEEMAAMLDHLHITDKAKDFRDCDLVLEAVFENQRVKQKVLREAEEQMDEYAIFGTNTVSIPISRLANSSIRPDNYVGLHFFAPAETAPLVEIVRGKATSDETIARAFDFVRRIKKIPIVVTDVWGFYAARVQNTYILEGVALLQEGYPPALIENLGLQAGMPRGPLIFADALGLELVLSYEDQAAEHYGEKYVQHPASEALRYMLQDVKRPGRAKGGGFYDASGDLWNGLAEHFPVTQVDYNRERIIERLLYAQVIESVWCMQEGIVTSVASANLGSIYGWGFPAAYGGVIQYIVQTGLETFLANCEEMHRQYGPRFRPPKFIRKLIREQAPEELQAALQ